MPIIGSLPFFIKPIKILYSLILKAFIVLFIGLNLWYTKEKTK